jgi:molybdate transport system substrate-binding protein
VRRFDISHWVAIGLVACATIAVSGCADARVRATDAPPAPPEVRVGAASSLKPVFARLASDYESISGVRPVATFGASGALAAQVDAGAPLDVLVLADDAALTKLHDSARLTTVAAEAFVGNALAVVVPADSKRTIATAADLAACERVAFADPAVAPLGKAARAWLEKRGAWKAVEPRLVRASDAAGTAELVARGEVDAGVVFANQAHDRSDLRVAFVVSQAESGPIAYRAAVVRGGRPRRAADFVSYLSSARARALLLDAGFRLPAGVQP